MDYKFLGQILKEARITAKLTQADVANKIGVTFQNISSWELGKSKIDIDTFSRLCDIYSINFVWVLERVNYLEQLSGPLKSQPIDFNNEEYQLIKSYRLLDKRGKQTVLDTVERETSYIKILNQTEDPSKNNNNSNN